MNKIPVNIKNLLKKPKKGGKPAKDKNTTVKPIIAVFDLTKLKCEIYVNKLPVSMSLVKNNKKKNKKVIKI
jgi:hypothetical protein